MSAREPERTWVVYLAGEIHSDWRERIAEGVAAAELPVVLTGPVTDHEASDDCGVAILAGLPSLLAVIFGLHWLGALLAIVLFALWCGRLEPRRDVPAPA
jgi:hypothetical protein